MRHRVGSLRRENGCLREYFALDAWISPAPGAFQSRKLLFRACLANCGLDWETGDSQRLGRHSTPTAGLLGIVGKTFSLPSSPSELATQSQLERPRSVVRIKLAKQRSCRVEVPLARCIRRRHGCSRRTHSLGPVTDDTVVARLSLAGGDIVDSVAKGETWR